MATLQDYKRRFKPHDKAFIMSALHFLSVPRIAQIMSKPENEIQEYITLMGGEQEVTHKVREQFREASLNKWFHKRKRNGKRLKRGKHNNVTGVREDLGIFMRSKMEANIARMLTAAFGRTSWEYEPEWFTFEPRPQKGPKTYLPDFKVDHPEFGTMYIEVKGRFFPNDKTKLKRFLKLYPNVKLVVMTFKKSSKVVQFCQRNSIDFWYFEDWQSKWEQSIPKWE